MASPMRWNPLPQVMRWLTGTQRGSVGVPGGFTQQQAQGMRKSAPNYYIRPIGPVGVPGGVNWRGAAPTVARQGYYIAPSVQRSASGGMLPDTAMRQSALKRAPNQAANPTQSSYRRGYQAARTSTQTPFVGGSVPVWLPQQAYMTEQQWGGSETIPWMYPPAQETQPPAAPSYDYGYGGGGGYYGGGYGGGGGGTVTQSTYIPKWLAGLVSWRA